MGEEKKITVGVVEEIILMPWGVRLPARIDTGAAMSSLDARDIVIKGDTVEFKLPKKYGGKQLSLPIASWRTVRTSEARERRPVVFLEFCLGSKLVRTQVNLNDRSGVKYPFLVGRNALQKDFVVDCNKERCAPPTCPEGKDELKRPAVLLSIALLALSMGLAAYRVISLGYPLLPTAPGRTWQLQIDTHIEGGPGETTLELALPHEQVGQLLVEEKVTSGALDFNILRSGAARLGTWSGRIGPKEEEIVYQAIVLVQPNRPPDRLPPPAEKTPSRLEKNEQALAERLAAGWRGLSLPARARAAVAASEGKWGGAQPAEQDIQAWEQPPGEIRAPGSRPGHAGGIGHPGPHRHGPASCRRDLYRAPPVDRRVDRRQAGRA